ncbi:MAG: DUF6788 family protein [Verrucomicrobiota bacterium]|jgi:hypothetical protein
MKQLERKIERIKKKIAELGDIRPGSLSKQWRKSKGEAYAEYWQLSYTFKGRGRTDYVPSACVEKIKEETENYKKLKDLVDQWIELSVQLSKERVLDATKSE